MPHTFGDAVTEHYRDHRGWLTAAVHHSIPWPGRDVLVRYDGNDYFLRGVNERGDEPSPACISVRLANQGELYSTLKRIYTFTSILGWFKQGYAEVAGYVTGSHPVLYSASRQPYVSVVTAGPHGFNCNFLPLIRSENTRKALAFWREGLRLEDIHEGYSFLSFYKIIESQFRKGKARGAWIDRAIATLTDQAGERVKEIESEDIDVGQHIYKSGRCAIAHASLNGQLVDPDIPEDRVRIARDLIVVKDLARNFIRDELKVPDESTVVQGRDALIPLYNYLNDNHVDELKQGGAVLKRKLGLNGLRVSVNHWPHKPPPPFQNLILSVVSAWEGTIDLKATNEAGTLCLAFMLSFTELKAGTDIERSGVLPTAQGGVLAEEIAFLEYQKAVVGNGIIELQLPDGEKVVCEIVIPVNIDLGRTFESIDKRIADLRAQTS